MFRFFCIFLFGLLCGQQLTWANNVRVVGDAAIDPQELSNNVATITLTVEWDNSWRDEYNYDAIYVFFKYQLDGKKTGQGELWHHAYLMDSGHEVGNDYTYTLLNSSGGAQRNEGILIYRKKSSMSQNSRTVLNLKWLITSNTNRPLQMGDFYDGRYFLSANVIEMVYIPRGVFAVGDNVSEKTFRQGYMPLEDRFNVATDRYKTMAFPAENTTYPPSYAVNRVNDITNTMSNAWYGSSTDAEQSWMIDFGTDKNGNLTGESKNIKYFAIESRPGNAPTSWVLDGTNKYEGSVEWTTLYTGTAADWETSLTRVYPPTRALKIPVPHKLRYYRIKVLSSGVQPAIKTIAMTEEDLEMSAQRQIYIDEPITPLNLTTGLSADDGDTYSGTTDVNYPNGYRGFYTMKYEVSQEQYVSFLNKLSLTQQKSRAFPEVTDLNVGEFVFGGKRTVAVARNGIVLAGKPEVATEPLTFAHNLNGDDSYSQDNDGQTLACNFLTAADMLAYADWCGLRPLTEMEYEKMSRKPYPAVPLRGEFAWNSLDFTAARDLQNAGTQSEKARLGNVNAANEMLGPLRCGSFAKGATTPEQAGASFWGVMDLCGNLAEIFYNVNTEGRKYRGVANQMHGDGVIDAEGNANISISYWPTHIQAFALRGGSFLSPKELIATSDRSKGMGIYKSAITERDSTVSFRLGRSVADNPALTTVLTLRNGQRSTATAAMDTVCSGSEYTIAGDIPVTTGGYTFVWYKSENGGTTWDILPQECGQNLKLTTLQNINMAVGAFKEYSFKRKVFTTDADATSNPVTLRVATTKYTISATQDTLDYYNHSRGVIVKTDNKAELRWVWDGKEIDKSLFRSTDYVHQFTPDYTFFTGNSRVPEYGNREISLYIHIMGRCEYTENIRIYVKPKPRTEVSGLVRCGNNMKDERDNQVYPTVLIGDQCWMAKNLNYATGSWICYENDSKNCELYGKLYNWNTTVGTWTTAQHKGICPSGWHVPTTTEWNNMYTAAGNVKALKSSANLWDYQSDSYIGNNNSRFSGLPGGVRTYNQNTSYFPTPNGDHSIRAGAWWWASDYAANINWGRQYSSNGWLTSNVPYYVSLTNHLGWSVNYTPYFRSSVSYGAYYSYSHSPSYFLSNFYMSVRCVKDVLSVW